MEQVENKIQQKKRGRKNIVTGKVVSDKGDKTLSVLVYRLMRHSKYKKYIRKKSVFKVHDEKNTAKIGDAVQIQEARPISKTKRWKLLKVVESTSSSSVESVKEAPAGEGK